MKNLLLILFCLLCSYPAFAESELTPEQREKLKATTPRDGKAEAAANRFLKTISSGPIDKSWNYTAPVVREKLTRSEWVANMTKVKTTFGNIVSREYLTHRHFKELPGAPDGDYLIIVYKSAFVRKKFSAESITMQRVDDGSWKVAGYFVR